jgi:hypothetical protein
MAAVTGATHLVVQPAHHDLDSLVHTSQHTLLGNPAVLKHELCGTCTVAEIQLRFYTQAMHQPVVGCLAALLCELNAACTDTSVPGGIHPCITI